MSERKHLPTLREFLDPVVEDMDPENCIEDEFRVRHYEPRLCIPGAWASRGFGILEFMHDHR